MQMLASSSLPEVEAVPARLVCSCGAVCDVTAMQSGVVAVLGEIGSRAVAALDETSAQSVVSHSMRGAVAILSKSSQEDAERARMTVRTDFECGVRNRTEIMSTSCQVW
jgi:hypothetical protein